jgi:glycosyltransferase involved in cell wall biosynthesis
MNSSAPFFSIIVPTYNRAHCLVDNLTSIINQTFESFEIIVVDDGSTDHTEQVVLGISNNKTRYFKTKNRERSHARNYGLKMASGLYVNYFDSDDIMYVNRLKTVSDFLSENGMPDIMFTHYDFVDENHNVINKMERVYKSFTKDILFNNFLATGSVFLKREIAAEFPFHEDRKIITAEDWELWLRVHAEYEFAECRKATFAILQHSQRSLSTITAKRIEERDSYFASLVKSNPKFASKYTKQVQNLFIADRYTFIALTLAQNGFWLPSACNLMKSLVSSLFVLKRRRFWGTIKTIVWYRGKKY